MTTQGFSRRDLLKSLSVSAVVGSVLQAIPLEAAEHVHHMIESEKEAELFPIVSNFIARHG